MEWSYGITTVPERIENGLLKQTIDSLARSGFSKPYLFVDGADPRELPEWVYDYPVTVRSDKLRTFGNWVSAAWSLYVYEPKADRYAVFQDDFVVSRNLRGYLEQCEFPSTGYLNLYLFPQNEREQVGWYLSNQLGKGAVALVFSNEGLRTLLKSDHFVERPRDLIRGHKAVDGGIVTAMNKAGWKEWVHNPSLVQHTGQKSTMGNAKQPLARTFRGEDFDLLLLVGKGTIPTPARIGLAGFLEGEVGRINYRIAEHADIDVWLVKPSRGVDLPLCEETENIVCPFGNQHQIDRFLNLIDIVLFVGNPPYPNLLESAKKKGKRVVCVATRGWPPDHPHPDLRLVDLFICPDQESWKRLSTGDLPAFRFQFPPSSDNSGQGDWARIADPFSQLVRTGGYKEILG